MAHERQSNAAQTNAAIRFNALNCARGTRAHARRCNRDPEARREAQREIISERCRCTARRWRPAVRDRLEPVSHPAIRPRSWRHLIAGCRPERAGYEHGPALELPDATSTEAATKTTRLYDRGEINCHRKRARGIMT